MLNKRLFIFLLMICLIFGMMLSFTNSAFAAEIHGDEITGTSEIEVVTVNGLNENFSADVIVDVVPEDATPENEETGLNTELSADGFSDSLVVSEEAEPDELINTDTEMLLRLIGFDTVDVIVSETIRGEYSDMTKRFSFSTYFMDAEGKKLPGGTWFFYTGSVISGIKGVAAPPDGFLVLDNEGKAVFTLGHGQAITIKGIPIDTKIKIESDAGKDFATFIEDSVAGISIINTSTGDKSLNTPVRKFNFVNMQLMPVPTGLDESGGKQAALLLLTILMIGGVIPVMNAIKSAYRKQLHSER